MLKLSLRIFYRNQVYTSEIELFYKLYKWDCGLYTFLSYRRLLSTIVFSAIGVIWLFFIKPETMSLVFLEIALILAFLELREIKKQTITSFEKRTIKLENFIRKFVSLTGKALGPKEWKAIKKQDRDLYYDLLCDECDHGCYIYSLEIAKIIKDSTLIWGGIEEPFEKGHKYYAHAIILRNGYIYNSNMRQSVKYEEFVKFYKFKVYKQWNYVEYSQKDFRKSERAEFREWCKKNNVSGNEYF